MSQQDRINEALLRLLRQLEWSGTSAAYQYRCCPVCHRLPPTGHADYDRRQTLGHLPGCELHQLILTLEQPPAPPPAPLPDPYDFRTRE